MKKGETLTLYTAKNDVVFPNFAEEGYSKDDVAAFCDKYGLNCTYTEEQTSSVAEGKIISQSRLVGSTVSKGTNLTVKYAVRPKATPSPSTTTKVTENKESSNSNSTTPDE